ncbi:hypothetical protein [Faecalimicrobium dakarense]|uniref:hypothetical protein n=1 Tax=Faecalimicrobium dakarense TaxID=1301100 RepID=UPI0004B9D29F|nr:hypothetical protein [[Clostridium] dakarense]
MFIVVVNILCFIVNIRNSYISFNDGENGTGIAWVLMSCCWIICAVANYKRYKEENPNINNIR